MENLKHLIENHWRWIPLWTLLLLAIAMAFRKDRGGILLKKRKDVLPEEKKFMALRAIPCDFYFALCFLLAYWRPNWVKGGGFSGEANP